MYSLNALCLCVCVPHTPHNRGIREWWRWAGFGGGWLSCAYACVYVVCTRWLQWFRLVVTGGGDGMLTQINCDNAYNISRTRRKRRYNTLTWISNKSAEWNRCTYDIYWKYVRKCDAVRMCRKVNNGRKKQLSLTRYSGYGYMEPFEIVFLIHVVMAFLANDVWPSLARPRSN